MIFLIDHNIEGQALMLFGSLTTGGWLDILPIRFVSFDEAQLPIESSDRMVWRFTQDMFSTKELRMKITVCT
jgi:hypothetical protein